MNEFMIRVFVFGFLVSIVLSTCAEPVAQVSDEQFTSEIRATWDAFIDNWERENAATCATFYMEDGVNIPPGFKSNEGRKEVEDFYDFLFSNNQSSRYTHNIESIDILNDSSLVERGNFRVDWVRNDSTEWSYKARAVTSWKKDSEGNWKVALFVFNNPPED